MATKRSVNKDVIVLRGKKRDLKKELSFFTRAVKEVTANILRLERDNCGTGSLYVHRGKNAERS